MQRWLEYGDGILQPGIWYMVWYGTWSWYMVWCGAVWYGIARHAMVYGRLQYGWIVWNGLVPYGMVRMVPNILQPGVPRHTMIHSIVLYGMVDWYGMVHGKRYGMVWLVGMVTILWLVGGPGTG